MPKSIPQVTTPHCYHIQPTLLTVRNLSAMGEETVAYFWRREQALSVQPPILTTSVALHPQLSPFLKNKLILEHPS